MVNKKISNGRKEKHLRKLKRAAAKREFRHESIRQKTRHSYNKMRKCNILVLFVLFIAIIVANFWLKSLLFFVLSLVYLCPLILTHIIWVNCVEEYEGFPTPQALYEEAFGWLYHSDFDDDYSKAKKAYLETQLKKVLKVKYYVVQVLLLNIQHNVIKRLKIFILFLI